MAAIYQWFNSAEITFTTTLYPIEAQDGLSFDFDVDLASFSDTVGDEINYGMAFIDATMEQVLLTTGPHDDEINYGFALVDVTMEQLLIETGPHDDQINYGMAFVTAQMEAVLIRGWMPTEGLNFAFDLDTANCSLTSV